MYVSKISEYSQYSDFIFLVFTEIELIMNFAVL